MARLAQALFYLPLPLPLPLPVACLAGPALATFAGAWLVLAGLVAAGGSLITGVAGAEAEESSS